jgi:hypothetical protein
MRVGGLAIALVVLTTLSAHASSGLALLGSVPLPCANQELMEGVRGIALTSDDQHLYVPGLVDETITVFDHDAATGALTFNRRYDATDPGVDGFTFFAFDLRHSDWRRKPGAIAVRRSIVGARRRTTP